MAVFTEVSFDEAGALLRRLELGELQELRGIQGGIENTNYFATALQPADGSGESRRAEFVLTLFERLSAAQLPFYLYLMKHLAQAGVCVPDPHGDASGDLVHQVAGKPAAVVDRLRGASQLEPQAAHCAALGGTLARMHLAGRSFDRSQPNLRGLAWWNETVPVVLPFVEEDQAALLRSELAYQNHIAALSAYAALPRGPVHADLFRDNALFVGDTLTGIFDFYFAGTDTFLFDLAVCLNDWCVDLATGRPHAGREAALLGAYEAVRPLEAAERALLPGLLRAGALRFWISRLWDFHLPREAALLQPHDPAHFERILRARTQARHPAAVAA